MRKLLSKIYRSASINSLVLKGYFISLKKQQQPMNDPIDFVVTWVDGNDPSWQTEKQKYSPNFEKGNTSSRYREWDQFKYWFRSVEKYAPWVRYVYLITWGHLPAWLNTNHPKLKIINHKDYIPSKYLPTFSSIPIELNMHRIDGLSEHFVYFNDDMYLASPVRPEDFFSSGSPKYCAIAEPTRNYRYNGPFAHQLFSNIGIINGVFNFCDTVKKNPQLWFDKCYKGHLKYNLNAYKETYMPGMFFSHLGVPFCKSTFTEVWNHLEEELDETCRHRFRTPIDIMHQIFSLWDIMNGSFFPVNIDYYGVKFGALSKQISSINFAFTEQKHKMICLNDSIDISDNNYLQIKEQLDNILSNAFPIKSSFEKE